MSTQAMSSEQSLRSGAGQLAVPPCKEGDRLGHYRIGELLGRGTMACVYRAVHERLGRQVALKCMAAGPCPVAAARFEREALAIAAVQHPHIVQVFDAGESSDGPKWIAMEYLQGRDLAAVLKEKKQVDEAEALSWIRQILQGLACAHGAGIVHRDLKPENVFVCEGMAKPVLQLLDFGLSKFTNPVAHSPQLTQRGGVVGTPEYMAPEQAQGLDDVDCRADLYAAAAILFKCLSGQPPHQSSSYEGLIVTICMTDAPDLRSLRPDISKAVADFVRRGLQRDRELRFSSAKDMLDMLDMLDALPAPHAAPAQDVHSHPPSRSISLEPTNGNASRTDTNSTPAHRAGSGHPRPQQPRRRLARFLGAAAATLGLVAWTAGHVPGGNSAAPPMAAETTRSSTGLQTTPQAAERVATKSRSQTAAKSTETSGSPEKPQASKDSAHRKRRPSMPTAAPRKPINKKRRRPSRAVPAATQPGSAKRPAPIPAPSSRTLQPEKLELLHR